MTPRPRLAVLASGHGTNLQAILDEFRAGKIPAEVVLVISDRQEAHALERAKIAAVEALFVSPKGYHTREEYDFQLLQALRERKVDWIALAGFMRILSPTFVREYRGRILNIHPALLPKYPGVRSIERAFEAREKEVGVTVHFVDEGVDTGPVIMCESIPVHPGETLDELTERVHKVEHRLYPEAIRRAIAAAEGTK